MQTSAALEPNANLSSLFASFVHGMMRSPESVPDTLPYPGSLHRCLGPTLARAPFFPVFSLCFLAYVFLCVARVGPIPKLNLSALGIISSTVPDSDNKVFIGGLPYNLTEDQVSALHAQYFGAPGSYPHISGGIRLRSTLLLQVSL